MCFKLSAYSIWLILLALAVTQTYAKFEFTNINCSSLDESFATFEYCYLKSMNRTYKFGSIKVNLHQTPVRVVHINLAMYQRLNGYKPFLYNVTIDACKFLSNRKSSPVARFLFNLFGPFSNINHTCPYNNPIILDKCPVSHIDYQLTEVLPFPKGTYAFYSVWSAYGKPRAQVNAYDFFYLKSMNRTYKFGSLKVNLHQTPIRVVRVNLAIYQRLNGYKPFLYNVTIDGCKFLSNTKSSPVARFMFNCFGPYTNINHTCPFNDPIIVDKVPISHVDYQLTKVLPFPRGRYGFYSVWSAYGKPRAIVNVFGTLS